MQARKPCILPMCQQRCSEFSIVNGTMPPAQLFWACSSACVALFHVCKHSTIPGCSAAASAAALLAIVVIYLVYTAKSYNCTTALPHCAGYSRSPINCLCMLTIHIDPWFHTESSTRVSCRHANRACCLCVSSVALKFPS